MNYDPNKTCGDYGGRLQGGETPCQRPAGDGSHADDGRCQHHDREAEVWIQMKKAKALELMRAGEIGTLREVCAAIDVPRPVLFAWRKADKTFAAEFEPLIGARDAIRADEVEDKVFNRIVADKASPAETIFFLKNRDSDRWKENLERFQSERNTKEAKPLAPIDSSIGKLRKVLKDASRRMGTDAPAPASDAASDAAEVADDRADG